MAYRCLVGVLAHRCVSWRPGVPVSIHQTMVVHWATRLGGMRFSSWCSLRRSLSRSSSSLSLFAGCSSWMLSNGFRALA
eukprot:12915971-Prorocentrum_lima.AAC.1